jgi:heme/copper-type cytochrome/quinol oxidase subunit 3
VTAITHAEGRFPRDPGWWGMLVLIATEAALFAVLLASYFYIRFREPGAWPPDGIADPSLLVPVIMTVLLAASSIPAYLADRSVRRGDLERLELYLAATLVLGACFLALQAWEYFDKAGLFRPQTDTYGSLFYTITGLHGLHVIVGLVLLSWVLVWSFAGRYGRDRHLGVEVSSLYWHFVHIAWLVVFLSLYLSPRL